jgi:hypothetical protein
MRKNLLIISALAAVGFGAGLGCRPPQHGDSVNVAGYPEGGQNGQYVWNGNDDYTNSHGFHLWRDDILTPDRSKSVLTVTNTVTVTVTNTVTSYAMNDAMFEIGVMWGNRATMEGKSGSFGELIARAYEMKKDAEKQQAENKRRTDAAKAP